MTATIINPTRKQLKEFKRMIEKQKKIDNKHGNLILKGANLWDKIKFWFLMKRYNRK